MVQRYRDGEDIIDDAVLQEQTSPQAPSRKRLLAGIILIVAALCLIAIVVLFDLNGPAITVVNPIFLKDFNSSQAQFEYIVPVNATNHASKTVNGSGDIQVEFSTDNGTFWLPFDLGTTVHNITMYWSTDNGTIWTEGIYGGSHIRIPGSGQNITFPVGLSYIYIKIVFSPYLQSAQYRFSLTIRPANWS
jgi:hypothetical protein